MRIAMIAAPCVPVPPEGYGGTERVVATLAEGLQARGHEVTLFASGDSSVRARVRSFYAAAAWPPDPWRELAHTTFAVRACVQDGSFDVIHAHTPAAAAFAPGLALPMLMTVHHGPDRALSDLYRAAACPNLHLVALCERHAELLGGTVDVVGHGVVVGRFPLGAGGPGVAFVGRWAAEKGPDVAVEAARLAGVPIRVAGRVHPPDVPWFEANLAARLRMPWVEVVGEVDHPRKVALFGSVSATLFPIAWEEPFGLVMIESMLCGTPVIAFGRGSVPELIDEGVTGWVVRDVEEMAARVRALRDSGFDRARCRARAARRFGALRMVDRYARLYQGLVRGRVSA
ncbi:MAG: hypothetical protein RLZZ299_2498 [Pseudomonadota bacterium]